MIDDHAPRIKELLEIERIERYTRPLVTVFIIALGAILADGLIDVYAAKKHSEEIQAASAFAACLNGHQIEMGTAYIGCSIREIKLVKGLK